MVTERKEKDMIRMGIVGCGGMGRSHLGVKDALGSRMRFTGFADPDLSRAEGFAADCPGAVAVRRADELYEQVDGVIVAVPHDLHHEVGLACLEAGRHVLLEKPLALTEAQCRDLIAADTSPDPVLMLGYVMRHHPLWSRMGQYIREATFGEVFHVSIWTEQLTEAAQRPWISRADRIGGGQLFSHGCHYIDLLLHWLGRPVRGTHVGTNRGTPWMEKEGTSNVSIEFEKGTTAYHFGTWGARGSRLRYAVHAHCTGGMLELDHAAGTIRLIRERSGGDLPAMDALAAQGEAIDTPNEAIVYRVPSATGKALVQQVRAFLDCIEKRKRPEISAAASLPSLQTIWRLYEAEEAGRVADLTSISELS
jgi:predicted dehydrogenase